MVVHKIKTRGFYSIRLLRNPVINSVLFTRDGCQHSGEGGNVFLKHEVPIHAPKHIGTRLIH